MVFVRNHKGKVLLPILLVLSTMPFPSLYGFATFLKMSKTVLWLLWCLIVSILESSIWSTEAHISPTFQLRIALGTKRTKSSKSLHCSGEVSSLPTRLSMLLSKSKTQYDFVMTTISIGMCFSDTEQLT